MPGATGRREQRTIASIARPSLALPEYVVKQDEVIEAVRRHHAEAPQLERGLELMHNTTVQHRHLVVDLEEMLVGHSFGVRNARYAREVVRLGTEAAEAALLIARTTAADVDYLVFVSCTGYMLPGPDASIAQELGCRPTMRRTPIQQLGCAAGATALADAFHFLQAYPEATVLVVAVELSSLCFQVDQHSLSDFISNGIFGDGAAAAIVRRARPEHVGFHIRGCRQHLLPDSQSVIAGTTTEIGFHFRTDPRVRRTVSRVVPQLHALIAEQGWSPDQLEFCVSHTGGPQIMDGVETGLGLAPGTLAPSRASMADIGNTSSVSIFDVLRRHHDDAPRHDAPGLIVAFGPGFTTEALAGTWNASVS
ncbi:1,3,6,8-tetrahydroxynaphthalene synthase [Longimycelium tulufanense]|uniref:1,3,6,8-tetrahydroxynaphthalene synthase n=1 Tax=Longimycelium tulufanense TaxID=907463 RepID=A0A8J3CAR3_9PSEU|nr:3-oxoacyl-[acyl-carrier-protein] synthase III C-terminal domain-containing protein [Longimycelium tulufanense]GGM45558.1 1,3,6,8-tetrahydroxynaphthalene synthase [Longimycelium tulufanense]